LKNVEFVDETLNYTSDLDVDMVQYTAGGDSMVVAAARVSVVGELADQAIGDNAEEYAGLINYLMAHRHGCYDSQTEVLTADGWKRWPEVDGTERFLTLNLNTDEIEYQRAEHVVHKDVEGPMVRLSMTQVDMLVTPDHNMLTAPRTHQGWMYGLHPARDLLARSHRLRLGGGDWSGELHDPCTASLVGFIAGDGNVRGSIEFRLRRQRKIDWLTERHATTQHDDRFRLSNPDSQLCHWAKQTYTAEGERCLPRELLLRGDVDTLQALLDGLLEADGSVSATGKITLSTVSRQMVDDVQELALKVGMAAVETGPDTARSGAYGTRPLYRITVYRDRNIEPRIGWTAEARAEQVTVEHYVGQVHCVTVSNGTLYVRRNGKPAWCGNTPFEHGFMTVRVSAPIMVFREWHRHRIGWSYNEMSGRYTQLPPKFYLPPRERPLVNVGSSARPRFEEGTVQQWERQCARMRRGYSFAYAEYLDALRDGVAKELARAVLGVGIYSTMYASFNPRSLMAMLSLRIDSPDSTFPSKPQWEIEQCALKLEELFADHWPITHAAWVKHGRVAP
jgi:thymidylate synthase (FAD)